MQRIVVVLIIVVATFVASGQTVMPPPMQNAANFHAGVSDLAWNQDGTLLAVARYDGSLEILNRDRQTSSVFHFYTSRDDYISSVAWSLSEPFRFAVAGLHGHIRIYRFDLDHLELMLDYSYIQNYVRKIEWSSDGQMLASLGETGGGATSTSTVQIWNTNTGDLLAVHETSQTLTDIAWNPQNSDQILVTAVEDYYGAEIFLWDVAVQRITWAVEEPDSGVLQIAWSPDGELFASSSDDFENEAAILRVHDAETGVVTTILPTMQTYISTISWAPNMNLAVSGASAIEIWDGTSALKVESIELTDFGTNLAWSQASILAYDASDGRVVIVDAPVIQSDAELLRSLFDQNCAALCYLGLEPGVTTVLDLQARLEQDDIAYRFEYDQMEWRAPLQQAVTDGSGFPFVSATFTDGILTHFAAPINVSVQAVIELFGIPSEMTEDRGRYYLIYPAYGLAFALDALLSGCSRTDEIYGALPNAEYGIVGQPPGEPALYVCDSQNESK